MSDPVKLVVLGSGGVGKSAITVQFVQGVFVEAYDPTIEDSYRTSIELDSVMYLLEILDTAGTEQFTSLRETRSEYERRRAQGYLLVYSTVAQSTFRDIPEIREQILRLRDDKNVPMILVGNKCDLEDQRVVSTSQGEALAAKLSCLFIETSAKTRTNIVQAFHDLVREANRSNPKTDKESRRGCQLF